MAPVWFRILIKNTPTNPGHKTRSLARGDKISLTRSLEELRQKESDLSFNNSSIAPCTLTRGVIKLLVDQAKYIFSLEDLKKLITDHNDISKKVLQIFSEEFGDINLDELEGFKDADQMEVDIYL